MRVAAATASLILALTAVSGATPALARPGAAADLPELAVAPTAATATLPKARLDAAIAQYDHWLDELVAGHRTAGIATAIVVDGEVRYERTLGVADAATGEKVAPDTVFRLASLSKAFASALTGLLVRQGAMSWDAHLNGMLPFFKLKEVDASQAATVRDILSQSIGLPPNAYDGLMARGVPYQELERQLDAVPLTCDPGDCYGYQNIAFSLIGEAIHSQTGQFFIQLVDRYLFVPLGMTTASYGLDGLRASASWARPHHLRRNRWVAFQPNDNFYLPPAAGANASIRDMEQWLIAQMGGRPLVLPASLLQELHAPVIATPGERASPKWRRARVDQAWYALGWRVYDYAGHTLVYHAGAVQGYRSVIGFFPELRTGVVAMWNCECSTPSRVTPMLFDAMLGLQPQDWAGLDRGARISRHARRGSAAAVR